LPARLAHELLESVHFDQLLCEMKTMRLAAGGTGIPMVLSMSDDTCPGGAQAPLPDGFYQYNEEHYTLWLAYERVCGTQPPGHCNDTAMEAMWAAWQGRRLHPDHVAPFGAYPLLSLWSGYLVQLPFYSTHPFNSDETYLRLFRSHWLADWAFYNQSAKAGDRGRYGLGAGPTPAWCTEGKAYIADRLDAECQSHCRTYSPYVTAGYLPAAPATIRTHLLDLLEDGEACLLVPGSARAVLWRKALLDPGWPTLSDGGDARITMVDFSSELLGLSTLWLGAEFFSTYSNHFAHDLS
jgi:hypothetical protein